MSNERQEIEKRFERILKRFYPEYGGLSELEEIPVNETDLLLAGVLNLLDKEFGGTEEISQGDDKVVPYQSVKVEAGGDEFTETKHGFMSSSVNIRNFTIPIVVGVSPTSPVERIEFTPSDRPVVGLPLKTNNVYVKARDTGDQEEITVDVFA